MTPPPLPPRVYAESLGAFAEYATLRPPELPRDPLSATQVRLHRWAVVQFPGDTEEFMALGIAEELGELADAVGTRDATDAACDALIYATQVCTANRLDFGTLLRAAAPAPIELVNKLDQVQRYAASHLGAIARAIVKSRHGVRGFDDVDQRRRAIAGGVLGIARAMRTALEFLAQDDVEAYRGVAEQVMRRDWRADRARGGAA